jgi:Holliday junction resolvasome RuvABC endonuclease subunit
MKIRVLGMDPALSNLGLVRATFDPSTGLIEVEGLRLVETKPSTTKGQRKNNDDIFRCGQLLAGLRDECELWQPSTAFCEVPVGSQNARAMMSYGACMMLIAACPVPIHPITPDEVKIAAVGHKTAAKEEMVEWAVGKHPDAPWLRQKGRPIAKNEHLADATAAVYAGVKTPEFQTLVRIYNSMKETV